VALLEAEAAVTQILLIKLGALGDVLRTTCLLSGLRKKWPGARVVWVMSESARPLLSRLTDGTDLCSIESLEALSTEWNVLINLDEDPRATALARRVAARQKFGVGRDAEGRLIPLSADSEWLVRLARDDRLKFRENQMPFQAIVYGAVGLSWSGESYEYGPPPDLQDRQERLFSMMGAQVSADAGRVGVFVGASDRYANKFWSEPEIADFCSAFRAWTSVSPIFLFGGPAEEVRIKNLKSRPGSKDIPSVCVHTLDDLASLAAACRVLVCGDTLAMHLALAQRVPVVALFGPTAHAEIPIAPAEGRKAVTPYACGPCYLRKCEIAPSCMSAISPARVLRAVQELLVTPR